MSLRFQRRGCYQRGMILLLLANLSHAQEPTPVHYTDVVVELAQPLYTTAIQREGHEGACWMQVAIDAIGELTAAFPKVPDGCIEPLAEIVAEALKQSTFQPWVVDGVAVPSTFQTVHRFELTRYEWWESGARPEDFPWPPLKHDDLPGPYTPSESDEEGGPTVRHRARPSFPEEAIYHLASGTDVTCRLRMYFDVRGHVYGAIVEACAGEYAQELLEAASKWRFKPYPEDAPAPGSFVLKMVFRKN
ncbi:MAG: hypothetical protein ACI8RZ_004196 [Myxococcota bacterium]